MHYYAKFAEYLADQGWTTLIYDYRGTGESRREGDDEDLDILMSDWMMKDVPAANRFMRTTFPGRPLLAVGHSVGAHGQFAIQCDEPVDALVAIASHAGVTRLIPSAIERAKVWAIFNVVTPVSIRVLRRVPIEKIGMGRNIPAGVTRQWGRWTSLREYFFDDENFPTRGTQLTTRFALFNAPVLSQIFTDDLWATRRAANVLVDKLVNAPVERRDIQPESIGADAIGHMGFFRSANRDLWPAVADWLRERA